MKLESLVITNQHVVVNDLSNFAHTAHHARRIVLAGHYLGLLKDLTLRLLGHIKLYVLYYNNIFIKALFKILL